MRLPQPHLVSTRPPCDFVTFLPCQEDVVVPFPLKSPTSASSSSLVVDIYLKEASHSIFILSLFTKILAQICKSLPMASLSFSTAILLLLLFLHVSFTISSSSSSVTGTTGSPKSQKAQLLSKRSVIDAVEGGGKAQDPAATKQKASLGTKNETKLLKPKKANSTATISAGSKIAADATATAKIKLGKTLNATLKASNSTKLLKAVKLSKLNSTKSSSDKLKSLNTTSSSTRSSKKLGLDSPIAKNKTAPTVKVPKAQQPTKEAPVKKPPAAKEKVKMAAKQKVKSEELTTWLETEDDLDSADLISEFRELPSRLLPDLERLSTTSKAYISAANKGIAEGVKPYVGKSFAPKLAPVLSSLFLVLPLLLLTLLFSRLRSYLSLHRLLLFIQAYLAIYFATLALTALVTGLEPLRFFYATSPGSYTWTQAAQTMGYLIYLVLQLSNLVSVFSGDKDTAPAASRALALAQMVIGLALGIHYYAAVFHRAVSGEPPRANWRVHSVYAACFLVICACARADRRKKAYYEGGQDGKNN
ncbi:hypothetical protein ZIOFF_068338 [Zingiber officinale]|uniref:Uncharacterized protein n=2 Tax=Zingiber officinale TaxID=94328 RepID=A0A8J5BLK6_ZINOF|nr:hypothetical protein ZIOFF_068338 [Zingiber officinale]